MNHFILRSLVLFVVLCSQGIAGPVREDGSPLPRVVTPPPRAILDAGHGGKDPGAVSEDGATTEKEINLKAVMILNELLKAEGIDTVLTRKDDTFVSLSARTRVAPAEMYISVHHDWYKATRYIVYHDGNTTLSLKLAQNVKEALGSDTLLWHPTEGPRKGLYIQNSPIPAVIIELGPTRAYSVQEHEAVLKPVAKAIAETLKNAE